MEFIFEDVIRRVEIKEDLKKYKYVKLTVNKDDFNITYCCMMDETTKTPYFHYYPYDYRNKEDTAKQNRESCYEKGSILHSFNSIIYLPENIEWLEITTSCKNIKNINNSVKHLEVTCKLNKDSFLSTFNNLTTLIVNGLDQNIDGSIFPNLTNLEITKDSYDFDGNNFPSVKNLRFSNPYDCTIKNSDNLINIAKFFEISNTHGWIGKIFFTDNIFPKKLESLGCETTNLDPKCFNNKFKLTLLDENYYKSVIKHLVINDINYLNTVIDCGFWKYYIIEIL